MALTPEDVVNKRFQPTKFREGYDQDEVDDFLDEVVVELRRLNQENEQLRQRLIPGESRINQLQQAGGQAAPAAPAPAMPAPAMPAPIVAPAPAPVPAPAPAYNAGLDDQGSTNNLLQLARTLHEQHVREGIEKRDALIAEGQSTAARLVQEAEEEQRTAIGGLEQQKAALEQEVAQQQAALEQERAQQQATIEQERAQLQATLEQERQSLESRIDELRNFERDYRLKLKGYIEGQLRELDATNVGASAPQAPAPQSAFANEQPPAPSLQTSPQQFGYGQEQPPPPAFGAAQPSQDQQVPQGYPGFGGN